MFWAPREKLQGLVQGPSVMYVFIYQKEKLYMAMLVELQKSGYLRKKN